MSLNEFDFVHASQGDGAPDHCEKLKAAVKKPTSQVHRWLEQTEMWAERAFGLRCLHSSSLIRSRVNSDASSIVDAVTAFLSRLRHEEQISQNDFAKLMGATRTGGQQNSADCSSRAQIDWAANAIEAVLELNPSIGTMYPVKSSDLER